MIQDHNTSVASLLPSERGRNSYFKLSLFDLSNWANLLLIVREIFDIEYLYFLLLTNHCSSNVNGEIN